MTDQIWSERVFKGSVCSLLLKIWSFEETSHSLSFLLAGTHLWAGFLFSNYPQTSRLYVGFGMNRKWLKSEPSRRKANPLSTEAWSTLGDFSFINVLFESTEKCFKGRLWDAAVLLWLSAGATSFGCQFLSWKKKKKSLKLFLQICNYWPLGCLCWSFFFRILYHTNIYNITFFLLYKKMLYYL